MEHHSNQTSWLETIADVAVIPATEDGLFSTEKLNTSRKIQRPKF
jgi:selenocysteine lyase/cysteine desulfurase